MCTGDPIPLVLGLGSDHGIILHWMKAITVILGWTNDVWRGVGRERTGVLNTILCMCY